MYRCAQTDRILVMKKLLLSFIVLFVTGLSAYGQSPNYGSGFTSSGLTLNGGTALNGTHLRLTDGGTAESRSAFFNTPVNAQSFTSDFSFQLTNANADGFTFTIQGNNASALGLGGGSLGYGQNSSGTGGIPNSVAVGFQLYSTVLGNKPVSLTGVWSNGVSPAATPGSDTTASGVNLHSGHVMSVHMTYDGTTLTWTITDSAVGKSFTKSVTIDIPSFTGNSAYVGFTGGTGGLTAVQDIRTWTYTSPINTQEVAMPTFSPAAGTYSSPQTVTISDATTGATIFYTTDGSTPTTSSTQYTGPITVNSTTSIEAIATASGMTNSQVASATYTIQGSTGGGGSPTFGGGFTSSGLTLNGGAAISGTRLRLTDGGTAEARSAFFSTLINVQSFITDFKFQQTSANADGFTFTIQGNSPSALGAGGGSLGYGPNSSSGGIGKSVAVKFDLYSNAGEGPNSTGLYTNGSSPTLPAIDMTGSGINLHSGHAMSAHLAYDGTTLTLLITDTSTNASFRTSFSVNIPSIVGGNSAYVGFTGGTGGVTATQDILTWRYNAVPVAAFTWPVATPITFANSECGPPNDYSTYCSQTPIFGQYHTGIDVCPQSPGCAIGNAVSASSTGVVELALVVSDASETLCDGSSTAGYQINPNSSNLGNVIVIAHPNGKFTLYGHLDCIAPGVVPGLQVAAGTRLGNMGHSGSGQRNRTFTPHTHFEMKDRAVTGDSTNKGYSGYTTDLPDGYGYHDARIYINPFSTSAVSPTAVKVVASSPQTVFTGPATSFADLVSVAPGQEFVAFATSGSWYQIYLPNDNAPISGWVQGGQSLVTTDPAAALLQVSGAAASGLTIQAGPASGTNLISWDQTFGNCNATAKIWNGQRYIGVASQNGFNQFYLPLNHYFSSAHSCAEPSGSGPSVGWASSTFLH
jgi:murein DD-endopeptidase MepM/ murein hydrolase activator NlpD